MSEVLPFRVPGEAQPAKPPRFPHKPPKKRVPRGKPGPAQSAEVVQLADHRRKVSSVPTQTDLNTLLQPGSAFMNDPRNQRALRAFALALIEIRAGEVRAPSTPVRAPSA